MAKKTKSAILAKKISDLMIEMRHAVTQERLAMDGPWVSPEMEKKMFIEELKLSWLEGDYRRHCDTIVETNAEVARSEVR